MRIEVQLRNEPNNSFVFSPLVEETGFLKAVAAVQLGRGDTGGVIRCRGSQDEIVSHPDLSPRKPLTARSGDKGIKLTCRIPPATNRTMGCYAVHLDRQLYRAMDQLERLQRQRRGEAVPPPLNINLGRGR